MLVLLLRRPLSLCVCWSWGHFKIFICAKKKIHVFQTIFTLAAGFLLASRDKKLHMEPRDFFGGAGRIRRLSTYVTIPGFPPPITLAGGARGNCLTKKIKEV
jgi:hypothetical protein